MSNSNLNKMKFCHELHEFSRIEFVLIYVIRGGKISAKKIQIPIVKLEFGILNIGILKLLTYQINNFPGNNNHFIWCFTI